MKRSPSAHAWKSLLVAAISCCAIAQAQPTQTGDAELPEAWKGRNVSPAAEKLSATRDRMVLNGPWRFTPVTADEASPEGGWGWAKVPGSWLRKEDLLTRGTGPSWDAFGTGRESPAAWYERSVQIPQSWNGRAIILDFDRVSTDAAIFINNKPAGTVNWPEGQLDITQLVTPGKPAIIRAKVIATLDQKEVTRLMGTAAGQNFVEKAELKTAGLTGNIILHARPGDAHVSDVFVQPSFREKKLRLDVELSGVKKAGQVTLVAEMVDASGKVEKRFTQTSDVTGAERQVLTPSWSWTDPKLWDVGQPNLYTLRLTVNGAGVKDAVTERFGFREFWIEGRHYYLNGSKLRARTALVGSVDAGPDAAEIDKLFARGFNLGELWPNDTEERSVSFIGRSAYSIADEKGFLLTGLTPHMDWMGNRVNTPEKLARFANNATRVMRRIRNHPSIVMWGTSGNMFGGVLDPKYVGQKVGAAPVRLRVSPHMKDPIRLADGGLAALRKIDSTRPFFIHHGGESGDVYTINNYLNFIPLQEREEWLSEYARKGDMPLWYVEFGTPVALTLMRGRNGFQKAMQSEPFLTEYCAMYLGSEAYKLEPDGYRKLLIEKHKADQHYDLWWAFEKQMTFAPAWLKVQELFITNTWRSWRTMDMTGGMIPWDKAYVELNGKQTIAGDALAANNAPTLAWIAGGPEAFTEKSHNFAAGAAVTKQVALLNDERSPQPFEITWKVTFANTVLAQGKDQGELAVGETRLLPMTFKIPASLSNKTDGNISLQATIGKRKHTDRLDFRGFPAAVESKGQVVVHDPAGKTSKLLTSMGFTVRPWDGGKTDDLLIVGREAMSSDNASLPGDLHVFVQNGGRLLIMQQHPDVLTKERGLRVAPFQARRIFPIDGKHPVVAGLDEVDLRDWAGSSTLLEAYPDYISDPHYAQPTKTNAPHHGWRWGTRGSVSAAAIEKPHRSGWRPILECEFDLAYSPLMELDSGKGRIIWSQLDLEDQAPVDPAAARLATQLLEYARQAPLAARLNTVYLGDDVGAEMLNALGVQYKHAEALPESGGLVVLGNGAAVNDATLRKWVEQGGRLMVLPQSGAAAPLGVKLKQRTLPNGSLAVQDWPELAGISASDTRWRTAKEAWLIDEGAEVAVDGQIARLKIGKGVAIFCQFDPARFNADEKTYFRLTRWRQSRAVSQLLANMGAGFETDEIPFQRVSAPVGPSQIDLADQWKAKLLNPLQASPSAEEGHPDPGVSAAAKEALGDKFDDRDWPAVTMPAQNETLGANWAAKDGESVFRKTFDVGEEWLGKPLLLNLGTIDDNDETYVNGVRVGGRGDGDEANWSAARSYPIPENLLRGKGNVISVRVWDRYGGGGFTGKADALRLHEPAKEQEKARPGLYHPDYRTDFELGDDPYRYYNW